LGDSIVKRDLGLLDGRSFDLVVVGAGIFGACAAWDASMRGLRVALIDRGDFASATSANSFKMIHGGIRYLQHGDLPRIRQSSNERRAFLRIAPHLVRPLPIAIPTYGHAMKGKEILRLGIAAYDLLTLDRSRGIVQPECRVPFATSWGRGETLSRFPGLAPNGLTGAVVFADGQMKNPPRLVLSIVRAAVEHGAVAANYVEADGFLREGDRIAGVRALDRMSGRALEIRSSVVLNAAGPYAERLLERGLGVPLPSRGTYSRDACFVVPRLLVDHAVAVLGATSDPDAILSRGERHLFLVPWRRSTLVGVWHVVHTGDPFDFTVTERDLQGFLREINGAYPGLDLTLADVALWNAGLVPFGENAAGATNLKYGHRSRFIDHARTHGLGGLFTLIGVRYTTGRVEAAGAVDAVMKRLGKPGSACRTAVAPVWGGDFTDGRALVDSVRRSLSILGMPEADAESLVDQHGTKYGRVLQLAEGNPELRRPIGARATLAAEIVHGIREEMALTLGDLVFRRTDLGTGEHPGTAVLEACVRQAASELAWTERRVERELSEVLEVFPGFGRKAHTDPRERADMAPA
jgi:glycerol-3-phosphate dehydrogenase